MDSIERKLIKEVLNADKDSIAELLEANPNRINFVSQCGESPLGIAIYKRDILMVKLLLSYGALPNYVNNNGDTSFHIAAKIGNIEILQILYETKLCNLFLINNNDELAYDIAKKIPKNEDVNLLYLFGEWNKNFELEQELRNLIIGRKLCFKYLHDKSILDDIKQRQDDVDILINLNADEHRMRRVLSNDHNNNTQYFHIPIVIPQLPISTISNHESIDTIDNKINNKIMINNNFHHCLEYNAHNHAKLWTEGQIGRYEQNISDKIMVTRGIFVKNYVHRLLTNYSHK